MAELNREKCVDITNSLVQNYYDLLEQLGDPELTMEVYDGLRLLLENKIPCTIGFHMRSVYGADQVKAQAVREGIYGLGLELSKPEDIFFKLAERQRLALNSSK